MFQSVLKVANVRIYSEKPDLPWNQPADVCVCLDLNFCLWIGKKTVQITLSVCGLFSKGSDECEYLSVLIIHTGVEVTCTV